MAEGTLQILGLGTSAVPLDYNVSGNQPLDLIAVKADFDGTSAGSDFVPVIEILSSADKLMAQSIGSTVAAGDSVTVTFAPFLRGAGSGGTGGGIQFDTDPQAGGFLKVTTTDNTATSFELESGGDMNLSSAGDLNPQAAGDVNLQAAGLMDIASQNGSTLVNTTAGRIYIHNTTDAGLVVADEGSAFSTGVQISSSLSSVNIDGAGLGLTCRTDKIYLFLGMGQQVEVRDSSNNPIFEVRDDGSLHGKTGQSLTFDL